MLLTNRWDIDTNTNAQTHTESERESDKNICSWNVDYFPRCCCCCCCERYISNTHKPTRTLEILTTEQMFEVRCFIGNTSTDCWIECKLLESPNHVSSEEISLSPFRYVFFCRRWSLFAAIDRMVFKNSRNLSKIHWNIKHDFLGSKKSHFKNTHCWSEASVANRIVWPRFRVIRLLSRYQMNGRMRRRSIPSNSLCVTAPAAATTVATPMQNSQQWNSNTSLHWMDVDG